jgi:hypothetical protein
MDDLMSNDFKNEHFTKDLFGNNYKYEKNKDIKDIFDSDPLYDLINKYKKRLQEIKEWQTNFKNDNLSQSDREILLLTEKIKNKKIPNPSESDIKNNYENNIKLAKDFLKVNCIKKNLTTLENNSNASININNIINTNESTYSILKDSTIKDLNNNITMMEKKYMKTVPNFAKKIAIASKRNNCNSNDVNLRRNNLTSRLNNNNYSTENYFNLGNNSVKSLELKLAKKRIKIKNLKLNLDLLSKENQNLKKYINELEEKIEIFNLNKKTNILNQDNINKREEEMINKIKLLTKEIALKNAQIDRMKNCNLDKFKIQDLLNENKDKNKDIKIEVNEKEDFKAYINNTDRILFTINYFIKKIYNMIPSLSNLENFVEVKEPYQLQVHLINIENFISEYIIYNSNKKSKFLIDFEKSKNNQYFGDADRKREIEEEKMINDVCRQQNIYLFKDVNSKRKLKKKKSFNSSKGKKTISERKNSKNKNKQK